MTSSLPFRYGLGIACVLALTAIFLFQRIDVAAYLGIGDEKIERFIFNRTLRFFLNDLFAIGLIYALFPQKKFVLFAVCVQIAGVVLILIPYFILKVNFPSYNGPLINFLHRLILNPLLMLVLIPAFFYQTRISRPKES